MQYWNECIIERIFDKNLEYFKRREIQMKI